jgi:hypothetical protein
METIYDTEKPNPLLEMHSKNWSPPTSPSTAISDTHFQSDLADGKSLEKLLIKKLLLNGCHTATENPRRHA